MKAHWLLALLALIPQAAPQSSTGAVQGTIVRAGTAEPIGDVRVMLMSGPFVDLPPEIQLQMQIQVQLQESARSAISDSAGRFAFEDVPTGRYSLIVQREGFSASRANLLQVTVTADKVSEITLALIPGAVVRGRVLDSAGRLQSNVSVQAFSLAYSIGLSSLRPSVSKMTDDRGEYRLFGVPPGDYYIGVTPRAPIANAASASGMLRPVRTFHPAATTVRNATRITVSSGEEISGIDIVMQSSLHVRVSGRLYSEVAPAPVPADAPGVFAIIANTGNNSASLQLVPRDPTVSDDSAVRAVATILVSAGEFQIPNVVPGNYDLLAMVYGMDGVAVGRTPVDVVDQDVTGITIVVKPGVQVQGTITIDGASASIQNLRVGLMPLDSLMTFMGGLIPQAQQGAVGTFTINAVPAGRFRLAATVGGNLYVEDVLQSGRSVFDSGIEVSAGVSPDPVHVAVRAGAAVVEGTVVDAANRPLPAAAVAIVPNTRRSNINLYRNGVSDASGKFVLTGVAPGEYKLFAWPTLSGPAFYNAEFLSRYEEDGHPLTVTPGARINSTVSAHHGANR